MNTNVTSFSHHSRITISSLLIGVSCLLLSSCGKGWKVDYGKPTAYFRAADVAVKSGSFVGELIVVRGKVASVDTSVPGRALVKMEGGITCDLGRLDMMAKSYDKAGEEITVQGILEHCKPGDILIKPSADRDPKAPFSPAP